VLSIPFPYRYAAFPRADFWQRWEDEAVARGLKLSVRRARPAQLRERGQHQDNICHTLSLRGGPEDAGARQRAIDFLAAFGAGMAACGRPPLQFDEGDLAAHDDVDEAAQRVEMHMYGTKVIILRGQGETWLDTVSFAAKGDPGARFSSGVAGYPAAIRAGEKQVVVLPAVYSRPRPRLQSLPPETRLAEVRRRRDLSRERRLSAELARREQASQDEAVLRERLSQEHVKTLEAIDNRRAVLNTLCEESVRNAHLDLTSDLMVELDSHGQKIEAEIAQLSQGLSNLAASPQQKHIVQEEEKRAKEEAEASTTFVNVEAACEVEEQYDEIVERGLDELREAALAAARFAVQHLTAADMEFQCRSYVFRVCMAATRVVSFELSSGGESWGVLCVCLGAVCVAASLQALVILECDGSSGRAWRPFATGPLRGPLRCRPSTGRRSCWRPRRSKEPSKF
jgi:hypothetical protein